MFLSMFCTIVQHICQLFAIICYNPIFNITNHVNTVYVVTYTSRSSLNNVVSHCRYSIKMFYVYLYIYKYSPSLKFLYLCTLGIRLT
jgi:hypothetical protein